MNKLFSYKGRAMHLGPYPLEKLKRCHNTPDYTSVPDMEALAFDKPNMPVSIVHAMGEYQATLDALRAGCIQNTKATIPHDPNERSQHLKAFGYFCDASIMGVCKIPSEAWLNQPLNNPDIARLEEKLANTQVSSLASGIDMILAMVQDTIKQPWQPCQQHEYALVLLYEHPRTPNENEAGCEWLHGAEQHRSSLRATETAVVLANYLRCLGYQARSHSATCSEVNLNQLAVAAGLSYIDQNTITSPWLGKRFSLAVVTTDLTLAADEYLQPRQPNPTLWPWQQTHTKQRTAHQAYAKRRFKDGAYAFEKIKRVAEPTSFIDHANVTRVPKRADMFARSLFGDMGPTNQAASKNGHYVRKSPASFAFRSALGAMALLQDGKVAAEHSSMHNPHNNADKIKATAYWLGCDAVGISNCPEWAYYSHNAAGEAITPYHDHAISIVIDQGHETMEGASGDDWISCAQSMRAYLRFALLGGVIANQIRRLGFSAKTHTVISADVVQPPLTLLAGLGEISRIGDVILHPLLGPRLKSGTITTNLPMQHDKPIAFGLQTFCEYCNKCARECPSGAITTGPKRMFNGYEIWKPDSQKCTTYRITTSGGAMCGRCMKTCPWNLEGIFKEAPFRWLASRLPQLAEVWAKADDLMGNGSINPIKKWWWDLELTATDAQTHGAYKIPLHPINERPLKPQLKISYSEQTLAAYPANLLPPPYPFPSPMDREAGINAYRKLLSVDDYKQRRQKGLPLEHQYAHGKGTDNHVIPVIIEQVDILSDTVTKYRFIKHPSDATLSLPVFTAGAHIDIVVAPEFLRQYSLCSDPQQTEYYEIAVLKEADGRGGSELMHRIFKKNRKVFIAKPNNHFPLSEDASFSYLVGGGIGITPLIAMAHRLHTLQQPFAMLYCASNSQQAAFTQILSTMPWADQVQCFFSDQQRANLIELLLHKPHAHMYTCGPDAFMQATIEAAITNGFTEDACHKEHFAAPEAPLYNNQPFILRLAQSQRDIHVSAEQTASQALIEAGVHVPMKCSDGICGVCQCGYIAGDVEHRDFVLSNAQRQNKLILCQSRATDANGIIEIDI